LSPSKAKRDPPELLAIDLHRVPGLLDLPIRDSRVSDQGLHKGLDLRPPQISPSPAGVTLRELPHPMRVEGPHPLLDAEDLRALGDTPRAIAGWG